MGVVLQAGQDDVQLHPLEEQERCLASAVNQVSGKEVPCGQTEETQTDEIFSIESSFPFILF